MGFPGPWNLLRRWRHAGATALGVATLAASLTAGGLEFNGRASVGVLMNDPLEIVVRGNPGLPVTIFFDATPGPTSIWGRPFPIGFTPVLVAIPLGNTDASGTLRTTVTVPSNPLFHGGRIFAVAVIIDPTLPQSVDISNGADFTVLDRNVDLAGVSLAQYPHFTATTAFNRGSAVEVALDPTVFPALFASQSSFTADVFVVAARTREQWIADASLSDVRGTPGSFTFSASGIQANTFTVDSGLLPGPDETPGSGDTRIGVGYDLVIDVDRDGLLGGLDLIDGYTDPEAGFYVVRDLTLGGTAAQPAAGPLAVTEIVYDLGGPFLQQDLYYPTDIAQLGQLPLVVISHGNGHNFQWYDHLGYHLASYGFIVMSHANNTMPGSFTAARSTLQNTNAILADQGLIADGALNGHIDSSRIAWIGHSRGGDGVVRAYDMLFDGTYTSPRYSRADIALVSSIAPTNFGGFAATNPHDATYHLWVGQGDTDVHGCSCDDSVQWYQIHDRATARRQSISLYGVGHDDFHTAPTFNYFTGPCGLGKALTHTVMRGHALPLLAHHLRGDVPSKDFLWRQFESLRPIGLPTNPCLVANLMYQEDASTGKRVIDDFESNPNPLLASSGAVVQTTAGGYVEGLLDDANSDFSFDPNDPFNGFTMVGEGGGSSRGVVFDVDGGGAVDVTFSMPPGDARRFVDFEFLSLRAAQSTRHPFTTAEFGDFTFTVTLTDGAGASSTIDIGAYGGGIAEPYQRAAIGPFGCFICDGGLPGWNSEFETIRIRLRDFEHGGSALDLADIHSLRFEFGTSAGSTTGRIGLDEIELTAR